MVWDFFYKLFTFRLNAKNGHFSVIWTGTGSVLILGHFFGEPDDPTAWYCIALYCIALYCIVLHCIALYRVIYYGILWCPIPLLAIALLASARGLCLARHLFTSSHPSPQSKIPFLNAMLI